MGINLGGLDDRVFFLFLLYGKFNRFPLSSSSCLVIGLATLLLRSVFLRLCLVRMERLTR